MVIKILHYKLCVLKQASCKHTRASSDVIKMGLYIIFARTDFICNKFCDTNLISKKVIGTIKQVLLHTIIFWWVTEVKSAYYQASY